MKQSTREWVGKAEEDYRHATRTFSGSEPFHDQVDFHCQQAAEKYLKAVLNELGRGVVRTHDLEFMYVELLSLVPELKGQRRSLRALTGYAIRPRYPGKHTRRREREAEACLRWAGRARATCRQFLGLRTS